MPIMECTALAREHGTPLFVHDSAVIRARCAELLARFDVVRYAQKANANLAVLGLVGAAGCVVDAVSRASSSARSRPASGPRRSCSHPISSAARP